MTRTKKGTQIPVSLQEMVQVRTECLNLASKIVPIPSNAKDIVKVVCNLLVIAALLEEWLLAPSH